MCCIPFFVFDLALGDVVATSPREGRKYVVDKVVEPSGRYVFRVWFGESFQPRDEIASELKVLDHLSSGRHATCWRSTLLTGSMRSL